MARAMAFAERYPARHLSTVPFETESIRAVYLCSPVDATCFAGCAGHLVKTAAHRSTWYRMYGDMSGIVP